MIKKKEKKETLDLAMIIMLLGGPCALCPLKLTALEQRTHI